MNRPMRRRNGLSSKPQKTNPRPPIRQMHPYKFYVCRDIVILCMAMHNFLYLVSLHKLFQQAEEEDYTPNDSDGTNNGIDSQEQPQASRSVFI